MAFSLKNFVGEDQSFFFEVVTDLFSEDTGVSRPADSLFHAAMEEYTDVLAIRLLVAIRRSPEKIRRFRCCTLLRRLVEGKWSHIHLSFQERCKELLFQLLRREQEWDILKGLCACVSIIASSQQCEWPELVDIMFEWLSPKEKSVAGILFSQIIPIPKWWDTFRPAAGNLGLAFYSMLKEASADNRTKTAIAGAAAKLMLHFHTPNHLELLAAVISVFGGPDVVYDEDLALSALDALNILGREKVELFTPRIMSSLANEWFPPEMNNEYMRHLIVKLLITVGEGGDQHREMIRNFPSYAIEELFTQLLHVIWVEDDISWDVHEMGAGKMPMSSSADHSLRRLAMVLGQDLVVSCLANLLPNYFNDNDWKKRYTGVISLGLIAPSLIPSKGLVRNLKPCVKKTMELIIHDRVLSVCCTALYTFCEISKWLKPYFQEECHEEVILALLKAIANPRRQTHATIAMSSFCQNGCSDIFKPYLDKMQRGLCVLLETPGKTIEAALSGLASLAESAKDDFRPFGDTVIDKLNNLRSKEVSNRMLVAKILHCITVVELAVGKSVVHVEKTFMALQAQLVGVDTDDEVKCVLLQALAELCRKYSSEDNFLPLLNTCMPSLIEATNLEEDHWGDCQQQGIIVRKIWLAIDTVSYIVIHGGIHECALEVLDVVSPIANFKFIDKEVRVLAISVMPELLRSAVTTAENEHIVTLANKTMIPRLIEALEAPYLEVQLQALVALNKTMEIATTSAPDDNQAIIESVLMVLSECFTLKRDRKLILAKYGKDFREPELAKEEDDVCKEVLKCLKFLIGRLYEQNVIPKIAYVNNMWQKDGAIEERSMALKIFNEIALKCREQGVRQYAEGIPLLLEFCKGPNPDIQQVAACAIGIYAEFDRETFKQHLQDGLSSLDFILQHPDEHLIAKEAAVCAYGKVCFFLREEINSYENIDHWLIHLPMRRETAEAKVAHKLLCSMVDYMLNTRDYQDGYFKRVIPIIVEVLWMGKSIADEETKGKMNRQLKMFKEKLPSEEFINIRNSLPWLLQNTLGNSLLHT